MGFPFFLCVLMFRLPVVIISNPWKSVPVPTKEIAILSGQIIATSHDLTSHGRVVGEPCLKWPYFREIQVGEIL